MNNRIRTLIVDDEPPARLLIRTLLSEFADIDIVAECSNGKAALGLIKREKPDLVFLDVHMPGLSGVDMLKQLDSSLFPYVVFVTAYDHYAVQAFELEAVDYIVKPVKRDRLVESLDRARRHIRRDRQSNIARKVAALTKQFDADRNLRNRLSIESSQMPDKYIRIKEGQKIRNLPVEEIICIKAADQYVEILATCGKFLLPKSLKEIENNLDPNHFVRIHRSSLVHTKFVSGVRTSRYGTHVITLSNGDTLRVSRSHSNKIGIILDSI